MKKASATLFLLLGAAVGLLSAPLELAIDVSKTNAPISPYIYGQFIEHLGRCIYGGIWAEMLEDRKFYFPITANYAPYKSLQKTAFPVVGASPWQIIGDPGKVSMVKKDAFVGDHSPRVDAGAGIRQRDLGLVAGRNYEGYVWAKPIEGRAEIEVTLVWGGKDSDRTSRRLVFKGDKFSKQDFQFAPSSGGQTNGILEIRVVTGNAILGPPSLMPSDNVQGMRPDTLALLKKLNSPVYRWPGGNFVSGYDWRDGIGDRDRRPPRKNPAWTGVEHNDFGTDEFIAFCREVRTEPMIAVNTGFGDAYSAAQWVEYCNGATETVAGGWRAKNGSKRPFQVKFWCVGNEMFGPWQLGFMQMRHYTQKHNLVADYMRKADPKAILVGVGDLDTINKNHDPDQVKSGKTCSRIMLEECADHMDMISEHFYKGRVPWTQQEGMALRDYVSELKDAIRAKAEGHRKLQASLPNLKGRILPIAMDEWNYWHRNYVYGELGCVYDLADALGVAAGLHEYYRQSDIIHMAHYAQTVNVIGAIKTSRTEAEMESTGLVLSLYRGHYGSIPLDLAWNETDKAVDLAAALSKNKKVLTVSVMNAGENEIDLDLSVTGAAASEACTRWHITGKSPSAHNAPGKPRQVDVHQTANVPTSELKVPPLSATLFIIPLKGR